MTKVFLGFMWLLHWLPLPLQAAVGNGLGSLLYWVVVPRRKVALTNLRLCFPQMSEAERTRIARRNFRIIARSMLERGMLWWGSPARIQRLVKVRGMEKVHELLGQGVPVILLVPHFAGLDTAATRLAMEVNSVSIYSTQKDKVLEKMLFHGRSRFGDQFLLARDEGLRPAVKKLREGGRIFYYLPDMDFGPQDSIFVPFFGVPAATVPALNRFTKMTKAKVVTCIVRILPWGQGYEVTVEPPWENFPSDDVEGDALRMNHEIERWISALPDQYYWVHKRFKTRPPGEPGFY